MYRIFNISIIDLFIYWIWFSFNKKIVKSMFQHNVDQYLLYYLILWVFSILYRKKQKTSCFWFREFLHCWWKIFRENTMILKRIFFSVKTLSGKNSMKKIREKCRQWIDGAEFQQLFLNYPFRIIFFTWKHK